METDAHQELGDLIPSYLLLRMQIAEWHSEVLPKIPPADYNHGCLGIILGLEKRAGKRNKIQQ